MEGQRWPASGFAPSPIPRTQPLFSFTTCLALSTACKRLLRTARGKFKFPLALHPSQARVPTSPDTYSLCCTRMAYP